MISVFRYIVVVLLLSQPLQAQFKRYPQITPSAGGRNFSKLCVFMDGTCNNPKSNTNVWRLFNIVKDHSRSDALCFYDIGVGADIHKASGAVGGYGFRDNIKEAYQFLAENHDGSDSIFLFGFSRGARQVQVLCDLIDRCGLPDLRSKKRNGKFAVSPEVNRIFGRYLDCLREEKHDSLISELGTRRVKIQFAGIWDSVESLGNNVFNTLIEGELERGEFKKHKFYQYDLPDCVEYACHAMAMDEQRGLYEIVPWKEVSEIPGGKRRLEQVWFPGSHGDVGGGYPAQGGKKGKNDTKPLGAVSLHWMVVKLHAERLVYKDKYQDEKGSATGRMRDSAMEFKLAGEFLGRFRQHYPRSEVFWVYRANMGGNPLVHRSVIERMAVEKLEFPSFRMEPIGKYRPNQFSVNFGTYHDVLTGKGNEVRNYYSQYSTQPEGMGRYHRREDRDYVDYDALERDIDVLDDAGKKLDIPLHGSL